MTPTGVHPKRCPAALTGPAASLSAAALATALARHRFTYSDEVALHRDLSDALTADGIAHEREVRLTARDRIDFMAGHVGIEVKVAGSLPVVTRQLTRYAAHPDVHELLLVTTCARHSALPDRVGGVPAVVFNLAFHQAF